MYGLYVTLFRVRFTLNLTARRYVLVGVGRRSTGKCPCSLARICHGATEAMARVFAFNYEFLFERVVSRYTVGKWERIYQDIEAK